MRSAPFCEANLSRKLLRNPFPSLGQRPILTCASKAVKEAARPTVPRTDAPLAIHEPPWPCRARLRSGTVFLRALMEGPTVRSEEHTSELESRLHLVCRLLLEKKKTLTSTFNRSSLSVMKPEAS